MTSLLLWIYRSLKGKKLLLLLLLIAWVSVVVFSLRDIRFSEDITDLLPGSKDGPSFASQINTSAFTDRVIFHLRTTGKEENTDLVEAGYSLVEALDSLQPTLLQDGPLQIEDQNVAEMYRAVMSDLPALLHPEDLDYLDSLANPAAIADLAARNFRNITDPTKMLMSKFVVDDPLGLGGRVLKRLNSFNLDNNLELQEGFLMTPDGQHLVLIAQPSFPANDSRLNIQLLEAVRTIAADISSQYNQTIVLDAFGAPLAAAENAAQIKKDIILTVSLAMVALLLVIFIFYRSLRIFLYILIPSAIGGATGLAVFSILGIPVSLISVSIGSILLGISVDYALHIFTHFRDKGDVKSTLTDLVEPILLSAATTTGAFYTLTTLNAPAMKQLGLFAGTSVFLGAITALILLPHLLSQKMKLPEQKRNTFIDRFNRWRPDRNKYLVGVVLLASVFLAFFTRNVEFEGDLLKLNYASPELQQAEEHLNEISSVSLKQVMLVAGGADLTEAFEHNQHLNQWLGQQKEQQVISNRASVSTILPAPVLADKRMEAWKSRVKEGKLDSIAVWLNDASVEWGLKRNAYDGFFESLKNPIPFNYETWLKTPLFSNFIHKDSTGVQILTAVRMEQEARVDFTAEAAKIPGIFVLDKQFLTNQIIAAVEQEFDSLVLVSLAVVFLILLLVYGRIELALFTFLPMLLAWMWTLGIMGLVGMKFNIFNIIVSTFVFGLGIDYSIFISRGMLQDYKYGHKDLGAFKNSIFLSAYTTTVGVGVLIFAGHPALRSIASMTLAGIGSMILITYTIQPLLYRWALLDRKDRGLVPLNLSNLLLGIFSLTYFFVGSILLNICILLLQLIPVNGEKKRRYFRFLMSKFIGSLPTIMVNVRRDYINPHRETFEKPAIVIVNHQSFIDILVTLIIHPNMVMVVKKWVYDSPIFGWAVRYAGYFHANDGYEQAIPQLRKRVAEGCSIVVFPEGTRSEDGELNRFHKGAFFLSEELELDIVPIMMHGNEYSMPKGDSFLLKNGWLHRVILPRIPYSDRSYGDTYQERTKSISRYFKKEFHALKQRAETPEYFRDQLMRNYTMKGPVLEWYTRIKTRLENNFEEYEHYVPKSGRVVEIGCGYGYLSHILAWTSKDRQVLGFDHDENKLAVASNTPTITENLKFEVRDVRTAELPRASAFVMIDVLHYLPQQEQFELLRNCIDKLEEDGVLLVRDADAALKKRQRGTWLTELYSTKSGFNKTNASALCFVSREMIAEVVLAAGAQLEVIDHGKFTSNVLYLIRKNE